VARNEPEERRKTLRTLIELAEGSSPVDCWDDRRAEDLLRSQTTPDEARSLGMSEGLVQRVFGSTGGAPDPASGEGRAASGENSSATSGQGPRTNDQRSITSEPRSAISDQRPATSDQRLGSFTVRVEARFEAAHYLREYRGISEPLHGHSYKVEAELAARGGGVDNDAIAVDFVSAKRKLEGLAKRLDYGCINDVPPFTYVNPSAENIAEWFHRELSAAVADESAVVTAVTVWEGPVNSVTFRAGG
jgi:6-pyruvoyltetrahydropterin/6-carboxytetrahydropterin synthase